jgi:NADPH:quinone reductase-like Zn-dependent oxidoreductase
MAALPAAGGTAMHALFFGPRAIKAGQTVLAQGTGGVSCFVIQLAAAVGANVIATSSSDAKLEEARAIGATHTVNYRTHPNWSEEVLKITEGKGVDLVVEVAGSSTIEQSLASTKHGGLIVLVGFLSESKLTDLVTSIIYGGKTVYGCFMFTRTMNEALVKLVEEKEVKPKIGKIFEWVDAKEAFIELGKQSAVGKVVIKVG